MPMGRAMFARHLTAPFLFALSACASTSAQEAAEASPAIPADQQAFLDMCEDWDDWDKPAPPFKIHGNTYYVGTCGISSILITTDDGHAVIDSGTQAGADLVLANIRSLGFDPADVKLLLLSHEHFDHAGGMAKLQAATGAVIVASEIGVETMSTGKAHAADPQFGMHEAMEPVIGEAYPWFWGDAPYLIDYFGISPIETPGHTPGAMSWRWSACDESSVSDCADIVYADSLSAVSSDDYKFSDHPEYVVSYRKGLERLREADCDLLLTPHPSASDMLERMGGESGLLLKGGCGWYPDRIERRLDARLAKEAAQ